MERDSNALGMKFAKRHGIRAPRVNLRHRLVALATQTLDAVKVSESLGSVGFGS